MSSTYLHWVGYGLFGLGTIAAITSRKMKKATTETTPGPESEVEIQPHEASLIFTGLSLMPAWFRAIWFIVFRTADVFDAKNYYKLNTWRFWALLTGDTLACLCGGYLQRWLLTLDSRGY